jgi:hypothetical protein
MTQDNRTPAEMARGLSEATPDTREAMVEATQADRDVLRAIYIPATHEAIDAGDYDSHPDAQAIARHRLAIRKAVLLEAAGVAEAHNFGPERDERDNARNATALNIARVLRSLADEA